MLITDAFTLGPGWVPPGVAARTDEYRFDIWASWEDIMALPPKARGEVAEARLVAKLMEMGFVVAKPFGDSAKWDLIVQAGDTPGQAKIGLDRGTRRKISRLQVKSAWTVCKDRENTYQFGAAPARTDADGVRPYRRDEIDFLVAYVAPEDAWYIIPIEEILDKNHLQFSTRKDDEYARYREAWELLE